VAVDTQNISPIKVLQVEEVKSCLDLEWLLSLPGYSPARHSIGLVKPACPAAGPHRWGREADDIG
jgi:hypothetical protein